MHLGVSSHKGNWREKVRQIKFSENPKHQHLCYMMTRDAIAQVFENRGPPIISRAEFQILTWIVECVFLDNRPYIFYRKDIYLFLVPKNNENPAP